MNWISVKDRLPELLVPVLVYESDKQNIQYIYDVNYEKRERARYKERYPIKLEWESGLCCGIIEEPTHWMPLPEPPKDNT